MERILVRSAVVRVLFVVILVLLAMAASAHADVPKTAIEETRVSSALYSASRTGEGLAWHARWVLAPEAASAVAAGTPLLVRFAQPLAEGELLEPTFGITPFMEHGSVTGMVVDRLAVDGRTFSATVDVRAPLANGLGARLGAPVARGTALQIIDAELGAGTRLEVEPGTILERRVGYLAPPGASHAAREEACRLTGYDAHVSGAAVYVRGDDLEARGLRGAVVTAHARSRRGSIGIAVIFGALVVLLFAAVRRLRDAAHVERADAMLAAEVDALEARPFDVTGSRR